MKSNVPTSNFPTAIGSVAGIAILIGLNAPALHAQNSVQKLMSGDAKVTVVSSYQGASLPKPGATVVYDFTISNDIVQMDNSAAARRHGPLSRMRGDGNTDTTPEAVAENVEATFANALVTELGKTSIPATKAASANATARAHTILVRGEFTAVDEGNKTQRTMVGLGRGASDVQAHVKVYLTTDAEPVLLEEFTVKSDSGKKPGAAATMGVGSAATAGASVATGNATDKKATVEGDASRMAKAVAKQINAEMVAQGWIAAPQTQPAPVAQTQQAESK